MQFVNLTPHTVNIEGRDPIQPSGKIARVSEMSRPAAVVDGVQLVFKMFGDVVDLPDPQTGTIYIVSMTVRLACPGRGDLASPGDQIRDAAGQIIGCKNLVINPTE